MRARSSRIVVAVVALAVVGCYDFKAPVDARPQQPIDEALLGPWRCLQAEPETDSRAFSVEFVGASERSYRIRFTADDKPSQEMPAYVSVVAGGRILNVRDPEDPPSGDPWTLVRYSFLQPTVLRLEVIDDKPFIGDDGSASELRAALEKAGHDSPAYEDIGVCIRVPQRP
jgi:hypothetical protein